VLIGYGLTAKLTGPPCDLGFQENPGPAVPVQHLLGVTDLRSFGSGLWIIV
jgi:hypothetical protein